MSRPSRRERSAHSARPPREKGVIERDEERIDEELREAGLDPSPNEQLPTRGGKRLPILPSRRVGFQEGPMEYDQARALKMCTLYAQGHRTLMELIDEEDVFPSVAVLFKWRDEVPEFQRAWRMARRIRAEVLAEERYTIIDRLEREADGSAEAGQRIRVASMRLGVLQRDMVRFDREEFGGGARGEGEDAPDRTVTPVLVAPDEIESIEEWTETAHREIDGGD